MIISNALRGTVSSHRLRRVRRPADLRTHLIGLAIACSLPVLGISVVAVDRLADAARELGHAQVLSTVRAVSVAVDMRLRNAEAVLDALSTALSLRNGDLVSFHERLRMVADRHSAIIILTDAEGQLLLHTKAAPGTPLPRGAAAEMTRLAANTQATTVTDIFRGKTSDRNYVAVNVPVVQNGKVPYVLSMAFPVDGIGDLLPSDRLLPSGIAAVVDRNGLIIARSRAAKQFVGTPVSSQLFSEMAKAPEGQIVSTVQEGTRVYSAFTRSSFSGWTVVAGIPMSLLDAPLYRALLGIAIGGAVLLAAGIAVAMLIGRRVGGAMGALSASALALGKGTPVPFKSYQIREANEVLRAMDTAAGVLHERAIERDRAESALRVSEAELNKKREHLARAQRVAAVGSWEWNAETNCALLSEETYRIFGISPATPKTFSEFTAMVHVEDRDERFQLIDKVRQGSPVWPEDCATDFRIIRPDGAIRILHREGEPLLDTNGQIIGLIGTIQDVTDRQNAEAHRRELENQLSHAQKMEALGELTGGLSHDFNNLLGVIIGNLDLLREQLADDPSANELLTDAIEAGLRGAELNRQLLAFARRQPLQPKQIELNELVVSTNKLLSRTLGEQIDVSVFTADDLWPVIIDPTQLETALTNLAVNARDAMPQGGRLTIATSNEHLDEDYAAEHPEVLPGDYVMLQVTDTGIGISPEVLNRVFEPFFTTKEEGKGTGLGLSMVFGFVKQSGGHIRIYSEVGRGTSIRIYLPRAVGTEGNTAAKEVVGSVPLARGNETILAVEDNQKLRRAVVKQLTNLGYHAIEASNGPAALTLLQSHRVDLLLTDMIMPGGMNGRELADKAVALRPALKVLFTSGFPDDAFGRDGLVAQRRVLLSKPYQRRELAEKIRGVLAAGPYVP